MIITQTPLRISFFGGGTDFPDYFLKEGGCVLSSAINRYIYVIIKERFDDKIRVGYSKTELVDEVEDLEHELVRECLRLTGLSRRVEIATMGDIPSSGSGMGSSSTVTVGLLNAIYEYLGEPQHAETLARQACRIEIDILGRPIGIQDQYIAAYGGQRLLGFQKDGGVTIDRIVLEDGVLERLSRNLLLFFTNRTRQSATVLEEQVRNIDSTLDVLRELKRLALIARDCLVEGCLDEFGRLLDQGWHLKKHLASRISDPGIDEIYQCALAAGALGGKITGAGGGGFMLFYCPEAKQANLRAALHGLPELPFDLEDEGARVIFRQRRVNEVFLRGGLVQCGVHSF